MRTNNKDLDGDVYGSGINGSKAIGTTTLGRWPANVIHDGSDDVLAGFPERATGGPGVTKTSHSCWFVHGPASNKPRMTTSYTDTGSAARFFYCAKASRSERNAGLDGMEEQKRDASRTEGQAGTDNPYNRGAQPVTNHHPTVKPLALMRYLCRLTKTPTGGTVLDPFMGSGSTGCAAVAEGREFIGIDVDSDYVEIARRRIEHAAQDQRQMELLPGVVA